jgi:hypothetical protein
MKPLRLLITFTALLLILSLSASVLAAQPKQGVYVKRDSAGNVNALMYVIAKQGKGPMASAAYELSITLEAVDAWGNVTEQMATDYVESEAAVGGTGLEGFRLTGENLRNSQTAAPDFPRFSPEHFSAFWGQYVEYALPGPDRVAARGCSEKLDGTYVYDGSRECYVTLPALIFIYERTCCRDRYENKNAPKGYYALALDPKIPGYHSGKDYVVQVKNPSGEDHRYLIADDQMNLVMETRSAENHFLFTGDDYSRWIDGAWRAFAGSGLNYVNSLFLYQYLTRNAPDLLEKPGTFFRQTDSWKGKADVVTWEIEILQPENGTETKLGTALVDNHGTVMLTKGADAPKIKKNKRRKK